MSKKSGKVTQGKKASKLRLNKETVKDLDPKNSAETKGGAFPTLGVGCAMNTVTCIKITQCMATCPCPVK